MYTINLYIILINKSVISVIYSPLYYNSETVLTPNATNNAKRQIKPKQIHLI